MKRKWCVAGSLLLALCMSTATMANVSTYLTQEEYSDVLNNNYSEDRGIVVENCPELGYLIYKNNRGEQVTANYYQNEVQVEKQPYYENEDKIGYLDEMFPNFSYDPRDTEIANIKAGDCIYIRKNKDNVITYISAYNDYVMRYGKVVSFSYNTGNTLSIQLQDEYGKIYYYEIEAITPVTKGGKMINPSAIKVGDWAKILVCEKILGEGIIEEEVLEIVIDNDTRVISNLYRGQVTSVDTYKQLLNIKNAQTLGKSAWSTYKDLVRIGLDKNVAAYRLGSRISIDYINRYLQNSDGYVYVAAENYKGSEKAVKLNFQGNYHNTLPATQVISATNNMVKLRSGETLTINEDSIVVRDNRLVGAGNIMVGDTLQAVITDNNQLAVGKVTSAQAAIGQGTLQVYRGRIKKVNTAESFQVETFSLLEDHLWYYHPTPQTFTIDANTKFYNTEGLVEGGVNNFVGYGSDTSVGDVYTIVAVGDTAYAIVDMPYVTEATKGEVVAVEEGKIQLKDAYYYDTKKNNWNEYSRKNVGATIEVGANTIIIKNGKVIPQSKLEVGDTVSTMVSANLKTAKGTVTGYIIYVEN